jgi:hypothetical protein
VFRVDVPGKPGVELGAITRRGTLEHLLVVEYERVRHVQPFAAGDRAELGADRLLGPAYAIRETANPGVL